MASNASDEAGGFPLALAAAFCASIAWRTAWSPPRRSCSATGICSGRRPASMAVRWTVDDGRVLQAVEASIRPPEPGTRCPAELAVRLATAAGEAMTADLAPEEWMRLLDAVVASPVRRTVKPAGIPDDEVARQTARHAAGSVPALAKLLGLRIPPPPPRRVNTERRFSPTGG